MLMGGVEGMYVGVYFIYSSNLKYMFSGTKRDRVSQTRVSDRPKWGEIQLNQPKVRRALGHQLGHHLLILSARGKRDSTRAPVCQRGCFLRIILQHTLTV